MTLVFTARRRALAAELAAACALGVAASVLQVAGCGSSHTTTHAPAAGSGHATATPSSRARSSARQKRPAAVPRPAIIWDPIPFGSRRKAEMAAYAHRHYGMRSFALTNPRVIVIHYTVTPDFRSTFNAFAGDVPDTELHELPGTCAHFVIDRAGVIHQLVSLRLMCRHTVGLNWTAIGIEHVGYSDAQILHNRRQMRSSLALVRWLRCRYGISVTDVIGHNENVSSRYHHEHVPALRSQTHGDFVHADMQTYRARLRAAGGCHG